MTSPYKDAALRYMTHGWVGPLPVGTGRGQKKTPPDGYTGNDGIWPTEDQIADWVRTKPDVNIALRLPPDIIGIDVDDYGDKPGADTMTAATQRHGKLPRTWISTARDGHSGIRWFQLSNPQPLPGKLIHPDNEDISGVEVIQYGHRYAIVPPSVHPEGGQYRWITPTGENTQNGTLPKPTDFPSLPQPWIDHILKQCSCWSYNWQQYASEPKDPVAAAYNKWSARITETYGRHDAALAGVMALTAFHLRGWPEADTYLNQLKAAFLNSLGESRDPKEAADEWQRMIDGAQKKAPSTTIPTWTPLTTPPDPETIDLRVAEELDKLRVRDRARRLFQQETYPPQPIPPILTLQDRLAKPPPPITWRIEGWQPLGTRVLLAAQYKAGKTTLTGNLARSLVDNEPWLGTFNVTPLLSGHVTIVDCEMGERQIDAWLADQGIEHTYKVYIIPLRGRVGTLNILDETIRREWATRLTGTEYLILDCLRPILDAIGLDEHREAGRFLTAFDTLCEEAGIGDSNIVHHMGHQLERSRGDSRLRDWPDVEWRLVRENDDPASPRYISAYGRDVDISESEIHHDPPTRHLTLIGGTRATAAGRAAIPDILEYVRTHGPLPKAQVEKAVDHALHAVREGIKLALQNGQLLQELGKHGAHLLKTPVSSSARQTSSQIVATGLTTSSARYRADEVNETTKTQPSSSICSACQHPNPETHFYTCPTLKATTVDDLPDPW